MQSTRQAVAAIASGTAGGQLIALACSPLISRLVPPDQYGPFAVINAAMMPLASIAALRLEAAVPLGQDDGEALELVCLGMRVVGASFVVTFGIAWTCRNWLVEVLQLAVDPSLLVWVPIVASLMGLFVLLNQLAIRLRLYSAIARRNLLQAGVTALAQVAFGASGWGAHGLALGLALGQLVGLLSLRHALRAAWSARRETPHRAGELMRRFRKFPLFMMPSALVNSLGLQAPVFLLAALYGTTISGWMGMTQRILALPIALVGLAMAQVFLGEFSAAKRDGSAPLLPIFMKTSLHLVVFGSVLATLVVVFAPQAFSVLLGAQWRTSGVFAQYMAVGLALQAVASPLSQTLIVMEKLRWQLSWDVSRLAVTCAAVFGARWLGQSANGAVAALGVAMAASYALSWFLSWLAVRASTQPSGVVPASSVRRS